MSNLLLLFLTPFGMALIAFLLPQMRRSMAIALSMIPLLVLIGNQESLLRAQVDISWMAAASIHFNLSVDGLSLVFLYLTAIIISFSLFAFSDDKAPHANIFYGLLFLLEGFLFGFFTAHDLAFFTLFWESMLIPLYFMIAYWGRERRRSAALKFLVYMIAGSSLMVAAVLALYLEASSFNLEVLARGSEALPHAGWLFAIFLVAFAVKTPLFPFHGWLPDAYTQASTSATILLSGLLSKAGIYGILRVVVKLFPNLMVEWGPLLLAFAIAGVFYGGLAAWTQSDFKRLIAYSSFSHVNFVLAGLFVWSEMAHTGAILQALNHGITISALFLVSYWLEIRLTSTRLDDGGGLAKYLPQLCWLTLFFVVSSVALPGTNSFVGELLILLGIFGVHPWAAAGLALTVILSVIYMLRFMQKVYFAEPVVARPTFIDIGGKELTIAAPLAALILLIGIYPAPLLNLIQHQPQAKVASIDKETL